MCSTKDIHAEMKATTHGTAFNTTKHPIATLTDPDFDAYWQRTFESVDEMDVPEDHYCQYPNGTMGGKLIACDNPAAFRYANWWFCWNHLGMVERGCLDHVYTDGTTVCENMEARLEGRDPKPAYAYEAERDEWVPSND